MNRSVRRSVAIGLTLCILLLSGFMYPQTVEHASHHAHHQASTHATALCSWMCSAGQMHEGIEVVFQHALRPLPGIASAVPSSLSIPVLLIAAPRGPPQASA